MKSFGLTNNGKVRSENQDCYIIEKHPSRNCLIVALCDGMGGENSGELASRMSNRFFVDKVYTFLLNNSNKRIRDYKSLLLSACEEANKEVFAYSCSDSSLYGMGTTLVGGIITARGKVSLINVGDSRAYLLSTKNQSVLQITSDHSYVNELLKAGYLTDEEAKTHSMRNYITRAVGTDPDVEADYYECSLEAGDYLLLCSDGLSNYVSDIEMLEYLNDYSQPDCYCKALLELVLQRGARDNVTILVVKR